MKDLKFQFTIYGVELIITEKPMSKLIKQYPILKEHDSENTDGNYFEINDQENHRNIHIIRVDSLEWAWHNHILLVHEIFHFVMNVLTSRGLPYNDDTEEAYAYFYSHVWGKVFIRLNVLKK